MTEAAGPPTKYELPLDVCWSAFRWSLNSRQKNKLSRTCRTEPWKLDAVKRGSSGDEGAWRAGRQ